MFFVVELKSLAVQIAGIRIAPDGAWMAQVARNLLDPMDGFLRNASYLIHDRDPLFMRAWSELLGLSGVKCVPIPAQSPNCNGYAERFVRTIRAECLKHFVIFGERHLRYLEFTQVIVAGAVSSLVAKPPEQKRSISGRAWFLDRTHAPRTSRCNS